MNPSRQESDDVNPIADQNTERLLAGAYRPETPDPAFLAQVTAAMHVAAAERVEIGAARARCSVSIARQTLDRLGGRDGVAIGLGGGGRDDVPGPARLPAAGRNCLDRRQGLSGSRPA